MVTVHKALQGDNIYYAEAFFKLPNGSKIVENDVIDYRLDSRLDRPIFTARVYLVEQLGFCIDHHNTRLQLRHLINITKIN